MQKGAFYEPICNSFDYLVGTKLKIKGFSLFRT